MNIHYFSLSLKQRGNATTLVIIATAVILTIVGLLLYTNGGLSTSSTEAAYQRSQLKLLNRQVTNSLGTLNSKFSSQVRKDAALQVLNEKTPERLELIKSMMSAGDIGGVFGLSLNTTYIRRLEALNLPVEKAVITECKLEKNPDAESTNHLLCLVGGGQNVIFVYGAPASLAGSSVKLIGALRVDDQVAVRSRNIRVTASSNLVTNVTTSPAAIVGDVPMTPLISGSSYAEVNQATLVAISSQDAQRTENCQAFPPGITNNSNNGQAGSINCKRDIQLAIDWGDGQTENGFLSSANGTRHTLHFFRQAGEYQLKATARYILKAGNRYNPTVLSDAVSATSTLTIRVVASQGNKGVVIPGTNLYARIDGNSPKKVGVSQKSLGYGHGSAIPAGTKNAPLLIADFNTTDDNQARITDIEINPMPWNSYLTIEKFHILGPNGAEIGSVAWPTGDKLPCKWWTKFNIANIPKGPLTVHLSSPLVVPVGQLVPITVTVDVRAESWFNGIQIALTGIKLIGGQMNHFSLSTGWNINVDGLFDTDGDGTDDLGGPSCSADE